MLPLGFKEPFPMPNRGRRWWWLPVVLLVCGPRGTGPSATLADEQAAAPVPLAEAAQRMTLPEGFRATLFAGEPDVRQPIAMALDDRGRLWIAECYAYPNWQPKGRDRIVIFEDTDGDGRHDVRKVFWDEGNYLTGLALGFGGVWVCCAPHVLFIPDRDADDRPDGPPVVVLDGWSTKGVHNVVNGLTWGPDGWLYGCNGITSPSRVGKPGTPEEERLDINCGIWRYHPTQQLFEVVCHGTTNPWGLDFDEHGQGFFTNCVIGHLWHLIPGAHYQRMFGQDFNPHVYELLEACSDHIHWGGGRWQDSRGGKGIHDKPGGGHAHAGCMIYLGDNFPAPYRGSVFLCNIHGNRVNRDTLHRRGSGYVGRHAPDFLLAGDPWFRGLELKYGPDGSVLLIDWSDTGECHEKDAHGAHHDSGRIWHIRYGPSQPVHVDLANLDNLRLVELQQHHNEWFVRHARRILQERAAAGDDMAAVHRAARDLLSRSPRTALRLRGLWTLYVTGGLQRDPALLGTLLTDEDEHLRAWGVRLCFDMPAQTEEAAGGNGNSPAGAADNLTPELRTALAQRAARDASPLVRLHLASAMQRLPTGDVLRWELATALASRAEDQDDPNLPRMIWYGIEPLVPADRTRAVQLLAQTKIPLVRQLIARRLAAMAP
jgi:putative membrane-bound dehydrogenase-like protein